MKLSSGKRLKWEPPAAMALVLALGLWLALGPALRPKLPVPPGATTVHVRISDTRGIIAVIPGAPGQPVQFQVLMPDSPPSRVLSADEFRSVFGEKVYRESIGQRNWVFRVLNITSWYNLVWVAIGFGGQVLFSGRMFLQWLISEKRRESVVTESFWWFSLTGALVLFSYFVWRQDPVGIVGQASGIVIYARNLRLIYKHKRRARRAAV